MKSTLIASVVLLGSASGEQRLAEGVKMPEALTLYGTVRQDKDALAAAERVFSYWTAAKR